MHSMINRYIFKPPRTSSNEVIDLLEMIFVSETLSPSDLIWFVAPWISDIEVVDNRSGTYEVLFPDTGKRKLRLSEVICHLMSLGTKVKIVTKPGRYTDLFLNNLFLVAQQKGLLDRYKYIFDEDQHGKGIIGENFMLLGSMNITYNGLEILGESLMYSINKVEISKSKVEISGFYKNAFKE